METSAGVGLCSIDGSISGGFIALDTWFHVSSLTGRLMRALFFAFG